ncbi:hypothetical protein QNI16_30035 [Cytophagaceae bacterium YF14B1]|uniref:Lipoprotein n=1 Tax=Xanthocytophaga flava TaxID=3048013 RepID=A0AAE3QYF1_9BACT|nr:hypothetical protein [Xanthocytophaga flavus]MDJ1484778.1 hypothetical protein [Xanthocytophaga flavus]
MLSKNIFSKITLLLLLSVLLLNCSKDEEPCVTSPPALVFALLDSTNQSIITADNRGSLKISYTNKGGSKAYISDVTTGKPTNSQLFYGSSYLVIATARGESISSFDLEISGKVIGTLSLDTYQSSNNCGSWVYASALRFNNTPVTLTDGVYMIKVN